MSRTMFGRTHCQLNVGPTEPVRVCCGVNMMDSRIGDRLGLLSITVMDCNVIIGGGGVCVCIELTCYKIVGSPGGISDITNSDIFIRLMRVRSLGKSINDALVAWSRISNTYG